MTKAPVTEAAWRDATLVLAVHGIRGGAGSARDHAEALRSRDLFRDVLAGCHKGEPDLVEVVRNAPEGPVIVAPLLMAEAWTFRAMRRRLSDGTDRAFEMGAVLGTHPHFSDLVIREGLGGCRMHGWRPAETRLLVVGHGTRRDPNSGGTTSRHAEHARASGRFVEVAVGFLDQDPSIPDALRAMRAGPVVAVGLFLDRGEHGEEDIPALLGEAGRRTVYSGPVGVDPMVPELVLDQVRRTDTSGLAA